MLDFTIILKAASSLGDFPPIERAAPRRHALTKKKPIPVLATPTTLFKVNCDVHTSNLATYNMDALHRIIQLPNGKYTTEDENLRARAQPHLFGRVVKGSNGDPILLFDFRLIDSL